MLTINGAACLPAPPFAQRNGGTAMRSERGMPRRVGGWYGIHPPLALSRPGSEGAIQAHHEAGTMLAASDPRRDGDSAVWWRFLCDSVGRRDRGASGNLPRDVSRAGVCYGVGQFWSPRSLRSWSSTSRSAGGMQPVSWLLPQPQVPQIVQAAQR